MYRPLLFLGLVMLSLLVVAPSAAQEAKQPHVFRQDFRGKPVDDEFFKFTGSAEYIKEEAAGLRILIPSQKKSQATGIQTKFPIASDCQVTVGYELLQAELPSSGWGAGLSVYLTTAKPAEDAVMITRFYSVKHGGSFYTCDHNFFASPNTKRLYKVEPIPTEARKGKLRLVRQGTLVSYWVADDDQEEFRKLHELEASSDRYVYLRVAAHSEGQNSPVEVRLLLVEISAPEVPQVTAQATVGPGGTEAPSPAGSRNWLFALELLGLALVLMMAVGASVWLYVRHGRSTEPRPAAVATVDKLSNAAAVAQPIAFACATCGKTLKAKAELAGRKVKCSGCGEAALVPSIKVAVDPSRDR